MHLVSQLISQLIATPSQFEAARYKQTKHVLGMTMPTMMGGVRSVGAWQIEGA